MCAAAAAARFSARGFALASNGQLSYEQPGRVPHIRDGTDPVVHNCVLQMASIGERNVLCALLEHLQHCKRPRIESERRTKKLSQQRT